MPIVDVDKVVNGTPLKRFNNAYRLMKENYDETTAHEFYNQYNNQPLSFILENSRYIFSEPYYGYEFYKNIMENVSLCGFTSLENEHDKVLSYIEENGDKMSDTQKEMYDNLLNSISNVMESTRNTRVMSSLIKDNTDETFEEKLSDMLYEYTISENKDDTNILSLVESITDPTIFMTYVPYIYECVSDSAINKSINKFCDSTTITEGCDYDQWCTFIDGVTAGNKLSLDKAYIEAVNSITNKQCKLVLEYFMNESVDKKLDELTQRVVKESEVYHVTPVSAVNSIFRDLEFSEFTESEDSEVKENLDKCRAAVYGRTLDIIVHEYMQDDFNDNIASGYSILTESMTLQEAFESITNVYNTLTADYITEAEDDVTDDDIDNTEKEVGEDEPTTGATTGKKPKAPKPKLTDRIQNKMMDVEMQMRRNKEISKVKGHGIKRAVKSVVNLPLNVINGIKDQVRKLDKADEARRKSFMTEPGFRKHAFKNLKLAILYGTAGTVNLSLVPVLAIIRHFSKEKDIRIRNELTRELATEIKVCEEKISDANAAGDAKEKYRLMRIKDKLEAEKVRVMRNSKYV